MLRVATVLEPARAVAASAGADRIVPSSDTARLLKGGGVVGNGSVGYGTSPGASVALNRPDLIGD